MQTIQDSKLSIRITGNLEETNQEGFLTITQLEIKKTKTDKTIQIINTNCMFKNANNNPLVEIVDINYDGHSDFILLKTNGQYGDVIYEFYIYDPSSGQFTIWDMEFNDGQNLINVRPSFDDKNKTITTYWHNTSTLQKTSVFQFANGVYELVEELNLDLDPETDREYVVSTHKKIINGKLRIIKLEMIPIEPRDN